MTAGLRDLLESGTLAGLDESQLLELYRLGGDARAFEAIVNRHGPMVLGVCRRRLSDPGDVEDAFQATFLILVRKAGGLRDAARLGAWLHGVARRVSIRASRRASARRRRELSPLATLDPPGPATDPDLADLRAVLDEELNRLTARDRAPLVLCYLEGRTHDEAAAQLGWPVGTVRSRLSRARERLRHRLIRRGLSPTLTVLERAADTLSLRPEVPLTLLRSTLNAAPATAAGLFSTAAAVSGPVVALADGVITTMWLSKLAVLSGITLGAVALGGGTALLARQDAAKPAPAPAPGDTPPPATPTAATRPAEKSDVAGVLADEAIDRRAPTESPTELLIQRDSARAKLKTLERLRNTGEVGQSPYDDAVKAVGIAEARIAGEIERLHDARALLLLERKVLEIDFKNAKAKFNSQERSVEAAKRQFEQNQADAKIQNLNEVQQSFMVQTYSVRSGMLQRDLDSAADELTLRGVPLDINILRCKQLKVRERRLTAGQSAPAVPPEPPPANPAPPAAPTPGHP